MFVVIAIIGFFAYFLFLMNLHQKYGGGEIPFIDTMAFIIFIGIASVLAISYLGIESELLLPIIFAILLVAPTLFFRKALLAVLKKKHKE